MKVPPFSETVVQIDTNEKGVRLSQKQTLGDNVICADSIVNFENEKYCCQIINCTEDEASIEKVPELMR